MSSTRRMQILRAVVEDYIRQQEPIGSGALAAKHRLGVSPATIRNDMAALEDEGYLTQPHTSAGRIPTEKGYRYFVNSLSTPIPLTAEQRESISSALSGSVSLQDTLQRAARILSTITGQYAMVSAPSLSRSLMRHVELLPLAAHTLLLVAITETGRVVQRLVSADTLPNTEQTQCICETINTHCRMLTFRQCAQTIRTLPTDSEGGFTPQLRDAIAAAFSGMENEERSNELFTSGAASLTHQHIDAASLAPLFDALEEQVVLMRLMYDLTGQPGQEGVGVAIGSETHTPGLLHASVVSSGYGQSSTPSANVEHEEYDTGTQPTMPIAVIGSIGPTHMNYAVTMAAVHAVSRYLTEFLRVGHNGWQE